MFISLLCEIKEPLFSDSIDVFSQNWLVIQSPVNIRVNCANRNIKNHNRLKKSSEGIMMGEAVTAKRVVNQHRPIKLRESFNFFPV